MKLESAVLNEQEINFETKLYQLVSKNPLVASKILTLLKIAVTGWKPFVKVFTNDEEIFAGEYGGGIFNDNLFQLLIINTANELVVIDILKIEKITIQDQENEKISDPHINKLIDFNLNLTKYLSDTKLKIA